MNALCRYSVLLCTCLTLLFVVRLKPESPVAFVFEAAWLLGPHVILLIAMFSVGHADSPRITALHLASALISVGGILFLMSVFLGPADAQNAIGVMLTPICQFVGFLVLPLIAVLVPEKPQEHA